jgi:hypothetical protein
MKNKTIRSIQFTEKLDEMVAEIMAENGYPTFTAVVHQAIVFLYQKTIAPPNYVVGKTANDPEIAKKRARIKVEAKLEAEKAKTEQKVNEKVALCENLYKGEVQGDICVFKSYGLNEKEDTIGEIPLETISNDIFENNVFFPSKDIVFKKRPDVAKIWKQ